MPAAKKRKHAPRLVVLKDCDRQQLEGDGHQHQHDVEQDSTGVARQQREAEVDDEHLQQHKGEPVATKSIVHKRQWVAACAQLVEGEEKQCRQRRKGVQNG